MQLLELQVHDIAGIAEALDRISDEARQAQLDAKLTHRAMLVAEELTVNALRHGIMPEGSSVAIHLHQEEAALVIEVTYKGISFDPSDPATVPELDPLSPGGDGLRLIHTVSDTITYRRTDGMNQVVVRIS